MEEEAQETGKRTRGRRAAAKTAPASVTPARATRRSSRRHITETEAAEADQETETNNPVIAEEEPELEASDEKSEVVFEDKIVQEIEAPVEEKTDSIVDALEVLQQSMDETVKDIESAEVARQKADADLLMEPPVQVIERIEEEEVQNLENNQDEDEPDTQQVLAQLQGLIVPVMSTEENKQDENSSTNLFDEFQSDTTRDHDEQSKSSVEKDENMSTEMTTDSTDNIFIANIVAEENANSLPSAKEGSESREVPEFIEENSKAEVLEVPSEEVLETPTTEEPVLAKEITDVSRARESPGLEEEPVATTEVVESVVQSEKIVLTENTPTVSTKRPRAVEDEGEMPSKKMTVSPPEEVSTAPIEEVAAEVQLNEDVEMAESEIAKEAEDGDKSDATESGSTNAIAENLENDVDDSKNTSADLDAEMVSEDELPTPAQQQVQDAEEVSDEELPGPKMAELPADTEVVSEDELPSSTKKDSSKIEAAQLPADTENVSDEELPSNKKDATKRKLETVLESEVKQDVNEAPEKKIKVENEVESEPEKKKLPELDKYWKAVNDDSTDFTAWTYLLQYVDQENDIEAAREAYDAFLAHYPYCYGYWRKYADYEKRKGNKKKCEEVFERGLKAIPLSVDLWIHYLGHVKTNYVEDETMIRTQFERALAACGLEFRSDKLWEAYIKWENEGKNVRNIIAIYDRLLTTPTQGYNNHFDNFRDVVNNNPVQSLISTEEFLKLRSDVRESAKRRSEEKRKSELEKKDKKKDKKDDHKDRKDDYKDRKDHHHHRDHRDRKDSDHKDKEKDKRSKDHESSRKSREKDEKSERKSKDKEETSVKKEPEEETKDKDSKKEVKEKEVKEKEIEVKSEVKMEVDTVEVKVESENKENEVKDENNLEEKANEEVKSEAKEPEAVVPVEEVAVVEPSPPEEKEADDHVKDEEEANSIKDKIISKRKKLHKATIQAVTVRWTYEEGIKRPYFHVKPLERCQLKNWKEYLDFEIEQGDHKRVLVLFERCLIACALYDEFWLKLIRYLECRSEEDIVAKTRDAFERACLIHHPDKPSLHLLWSAFEENNDNANKAAEILTNLEKVAPHLVQVAYRRINLERRRGDMAKCVQLYDYYIGQAKNKAVIGNIAIKYARFLHKIQKDIDAAINVLKESLDKDPSNTRLALQLIDLALQRETIDEKEVVDIMDSFMARDTLDIDQKVLFAQRKVEFLEDFGASSKELQEAQRALQTIMNKANETKKKREQSPPKKSKETTAAATTAPTPTYTAANSYSYSNSSQPYNYGSGQAATNYQYGDGYNYSQWNQQYSQTGYGNYSQWSGYGNYY